MDKTRKSHFIASAIAALAIGVCSSGAVAGGFLDVEFEEASFPGSLAIDNPYWPLYPDEGTPTAFIYLGETEDGCVFNKITVDPSQTKTFADSEEDYEYYDGVMAQVVLDREWEIEDEDCETVLDLLAGDPGYEPEEGLGELTFDWYKQDTKLNIWYMGEASRDFGDECPSEFEVPLGTLRENWPDDELFLECTGGSWEAGQLGQEDKEIVGEAGIVVPGDEPISGEPLTPGTYYMQEVAEGAEDMAKILRLDASVSVDEEFFEGDYERCRKAKEWTALEPGESVEHKWYCYNEGLVLIQGIGGGPTESEVLIYTSP